VLPAHPSFRARRATAHAATLLAAPRCIVTQAARASGVVPPRANVQRCFACRAAL
jgi:hypothetical protein